MMSLRDKDGPFYNTKPEVGHSSKPSAAAPASSSSRQWSSGFKNPRIVRVSRTLGGKDRHSKVCTIKGLRDRRIRLSVPTAIQLYDLQDRLGLSQPSKVIDWLIDTTKEDIDKLPPLPIIPGCFDPSQGYGVPLTTSSSFFDTSLLSSRKGGININCTTQDLDGAEEEDQSLMAKLKYWNSNSMMRSKQKGHDQGSTSQVLAQNLFPIASTNNDNNSTNNSMLPPPHHPNPNPNPNPTFLSNNPMFNYYHWEPSSNLSLTQLGSLGLPSSHQDDHTQGSSQTSSVSQLFLCPSMTTSSFFPQNNRNHHASFINSNQVENEMRHLNQFALSNNPFSSSFHNSSGLDMKPFSLSMNHLHHSEEETRHGKTTHISPWNKPSSGN